MHFVIVFWLTTLRSLAAVHLERLLSHHRRRMRGCADMEDIVAGATSACMSTLAMDNCRLAPCDAVKNSPHDADANQSQLLPDLHVLNGLLD